MHSATNKSTYISSRLLPDGQPLPVVDERVRSDDGGAEYSEDGAAIGDPGGLQQLDEAHLDLRALLHSELALLAQHGQGEERTRPPDGTGPDPGGTAGHDKLGTFGGLVLAAIVKVAVDPSLFRNRIL